MYVYMDKYVYICIYSSIFSLYMYTDTENETNGKQKFIFLSKQKINGYLRLLFQQMCPSMYKCNYVTTMRFSPFHTYSIHTIHT